MLRSSKVFLAALALAVVIPLSGCSAGLPGSTGSEGVAGPPGVAGADGVDGLPGPAGPAGPAGAQGAQGARGATGAAGAPGAAGSGSGIPGLTGPAGATGLTGPVGAPGAAGAIGAAGLMGPPGPQGPAGPQGPTGAAGLDGATGAAGAPGAIGLTGAAGSGELALFYSAPGDNPAVPVGGAVMFSMAGPSTNSVAISTGASFIVPTAGIYEVTYQVPAAEAGRLVLSLNGVLLDYTAAGRFTGTNTISHTTAVQVQAFDTIAVVNDGLSALTVDQNVGPGFVPASLIFTLVKAL